MKLTKLKLKNIIKEVLDESNKDKLKGIYDTFEDLEWLIKTGIEKKKIRGPREIDDDWAARIAGSIEGLKNQLGL